MTHKKAGGDFSPPTFDDTPFSHRPMAVLLRKGYTRRCREEQRRVPYAELAREIGVKPDQVSRWLRGTDVPYKDTRYELEAIAKSFQVPFVEVHEAARFRPKRGQAYTKTGRYVKTDG